MNPPAPRPDDAPARSNAYRSGGEGQQPAGDVFGFQLDDETWTRKVAKHVVDDRSGAKGDAQPSCETQSVPDTSRFVDRLRRHVDHGTLNQHPETVGPYRILEVLGEGGMGVVYLAEQEKPIRRRVALKVIKAGMDTKAVIARFEQERQALAVMDHPNVARVLDAGATEQGRPYFVMEHVAGEPITAYCDRHKLTIEQRLELFIPVCEAVQHAHHKGIIHRDLKPSNLLVSVHGDRAVPKVIDFGVAKAVSHTLTDKTIFTESGQMIGTPEYMSPEQAEMRGTDIDTRTDVYSLGAVLYELLSGKVPFEPKELRSAGYNEILRIIREHDPPKPSTRLTSLGPEDSAVIAQNRRVERAALAASLRRELDWIPLKALRKDRTERYGSPADLAREIRNYLEGRPLEAGPESAAYRFNKLVRRNKGIFGAAASLFIVLMAGFIVSTELYFHAERATESALKERDKVQEFAQFMEETLKGVGPAVALGRDTAIIKEMMDQASKRILAGELKSNPEAELRLRLTIGDTYDQITSFDAAWQMLEPTVEMAKRLYGAESAEYANALTIHGTFSHLDDSQALRELQEALAIRRGLFSGDHPDVAASLAHVASHLYTSPVEALRLHEESLAMYQGVYRDDHERIALALSAVAYCLGVLGRPIEALAKQEEAVAMWQRLLPDGNLEVATAIGSLAAHLQTLSRTEEALAKAQESYTIKKRIFGPEHPAVTHAQARLADCLLELGHHSEALRNYEEALVIDRRNNWSYRIASELLDTGRCLEVMGNYSDALVLYEESVEICKSHFSSDHIQVAHALRMHAFCLLELDRAGEAIPEFQEALSIYRAKLPADNWRIALSGAGLANALAAAGRLEEAKAMIDPAWDAIPDNVGVVKWNKQKASRALVKLFVLLDTAEPGRGYGGMAAKWQAAHDQAEIGQGRRAADPDPGSGDK